MNIFDRLKQLKSLLPREDYTLRSRSFILSNEQDAVIPRVRLTVWQFVLQNVQMGSAIALTALLLLLGLGGFSAWKFLSPFGLRSLDPAGLRAEADAVQDIQIALKTVQYNAPATTPAAASAAKTTPAPSKQSLIAVTSSSSSSAAITGAPQNATTTPATAATSSTGDNFSTTTVDAALDYLLQ